MNHPGLSQFPFDVYNGLGLTEQFKLVLFAPGKYVKTMPEEQITMIRVTSNSPDRQTKAGKTPADIRDKTSCGSCPRGNIPDCRFEGATMP